MNEITDEVIAKDLAWLEAEYLKAASIIKNAREGAFGNTNPGQLIYDLMLYQARILETMDTVAKSK
jgi:hypothetical protein